MYLDFYGLIIIITSKIYKRCFWTCSITISPGSLAKLLESNENLYPEWYVR